MWNKTNSPISSRKYGNARAPLRPDGISNMSSFPPICAAALVFYHFFQNVPFFWEIFPNWGLKEESSFHHIPSRHSSWLTTLAGFWVECKIKWQEVSSKLFSSCGMARHENMVYNCSHQATAKISSYALLPNSEKNYLVSGKTISHGGIIRISWVF